MLAGFTGRGVRIALIDSGVNPHHSHLTRVAPGHSLVSDDTLDHIGHGTAIAGVVHWWASQAEIVPVKIFDHQLRCPTELAQQAVAWAVEQAIPLIGLSLAGREEEGWSNCIPSSSLLVASAANRFAGGFPAVLPGVLGVQGVPAHTFRSLDGPIDLEAPGLPRSLPEDRPNFRGNSMAVGHALGLLARRLEQQPESTPAQLLAWLRQSG
ncbi:MAG: S8 family serine peptidase [Vulcanimicrobiota bacterium]